MREAFRYIKFITQQRAQLVCIHTLLCYIPPAPHPLRWMAWKPASTHQVNVGRRESGAGLETRGARMPPGGSESGPSGGAWGPLGDQGGPRKIKGGLRFEA